MSSSRNYFGSSGSSPDPFDSTAKSAIDSFNSAVIVSVVVSSIATIAIVIAIIYCIKMAVESAPKYMQLAIDAQQYKHHEQRKAVDSDHPNFVELTNMEVLEAATMERFLSDMAKEKPLRFSSQQLRDFTDNFSNRLGSGGFGVVYKGDFPNGIPIAVKVLNSNLGKRVEEQFMAEVATMGRTYHINLVRLYGFCFDSTLQALVYEYMENDSLDHLLFHQNPNNNNNNNNLDWNKMQEIALGTAKGIAYLHEECQQRIIHYDIKPGNILLDSNLNPKVADFGLAKLCNRDNTHVELSGLKGTPGYAAPEVWMPYPVTHKCDVYSFGMLLMEMVSRRRNHVGGDLSGTSREWMPRWVYEKVERKEVEVMMAELGVEGTSREKAERAALVALWCVQYLPSARPNMSDVVRMLEGAASIPTPPNPFAHLVADANSGGGRDGMGSSSWGGNTSSVGHTNHTFPLIFERRVDVVDNGNATY